MRKISNPFVNFKLFDYILWLGSIVIIVAVFFSLNSKNYFTLASSICGVTSLIFIAKGHIFGNIIGVIFSIIYGIVSYFFGYYGEIITYLGMTAPMSIITIVAWYKHPFTKTKEVEVAKVNLKKLLYVSLATIIVTIAFYFILRALNTTNLIVSTISVATSFFAVSLSFLRSPYYAIAYSFNDIILIVLWIFASIDDIKYVPMVVCFSLFLLFDIYGFISWIRMRKKQNNIKKESEYCPDSLINSSDDRLE